MKNIELNNLRAGQMVECMKRNGNFKEGQLYPIYNICGSEQIIDVMCDVPAPFKYEEINTYFRLPVLTEGKEYECVSEMASKTFTTLKRNSKYKYLGIRLPDEFVFTSEYSAPIYLTASEVFTHFGIVVGEENCCTNCGSELHDTEMCPTISDQPKPEESKFTGNCGTKFCNENGCAEDKVKSNNSLGAPKPEEDTEYKKYIDSIGFKGFSDDNAKREEAEKCIEALSNMPEIIKAAKLIQSTYDYLDLKSHIKLDFLFQNNNGESGASCLMFIKYPVPPELDQNVFKDQIAQLQSRIKELEEELFTLRRFRIEDAASALDEQNRLHSQIQALKANGVHR